MSSGTFVLDMKNFINMTKERMDKVVRASVSDLGASVIISTPVDTGQLRNNWFPSSGEPSQLTTVETSKDGSIPLERLKQFVSGDAFKGDIWFVNNMKYGPRIEYEGWSAAKAPSGMVRINTIRWPQIVAQNAKAIK